MEGDSKSANLHTQMFDLNGVEFDNHNLAEKYDDHHNDTDENSSKGTSKIESLVLIGSGSSPSLTNDEPNSPALVQTNELLPSPLKIDNGKISHSPAHDTALIQASQEMQKTTSKMVGGSKSENVESQMLDLNEVVFGNHNLMEKYDEQHNEAEGNSSKGIMETMGSLASVSSPHQTNDRSPSEIHGGKLSPSVPTHDSTKTEASHEMQKTTDNVVGELGSPSTKDDEADDLDQMKAKPADNFDNLTLLPEQVEMASEHGSTFESFPDQNQMEEEAFSRLDGSESSLIGDAKFDEQQITPSPTLSPHIMQSTESFPLAVDKKEGNSKSSNLELEMFDSNEANFNIHNLLGKCEDEHNQIDGNFSKGMVDIIGSSAGGGGSSPPLTTDQPNSRHNSPAPAHEPTLIEMPKTAVPAYNQDDEPHDPLLPADTLEHGYASHDNLNPLPEQVEMALEPAGSIVESFPPHDQRSNPNQLMEGAFSGFNGSESSLIGDAKFDEHQLIPSPPFSPLIMQPTQSFPLELGENFTLNESYEGGQPSHEVNSVQANHPHGGSLQADIARPPMVEPDSRGKSTSFGVPLEQNNRNNHFNNNIQQQAAVLPNPNPLPQYPSTTGYGHMNGPTQFNQQQGAVVPSRMAPSGSQVNQINATNNVDPLCYNFMLPRSSAPNLRPLHLNNPMQLLNHHGIPSLLNASNSLLQQQQQQQPVPMQHTPNQPYSNQHNLIQPYNPQFYSHLLPESPMPSSRTQMLFPPNHQINPLNGSRGPTLPSGSGGYNFQGLNDQPNHQFNTAGRMTTNLLGSQFSRSMLQEPLMPNSGSYQQFLMMTSLPNSDHRHNSYHSYRPGLQTVPQQGFPNLTTRPVAAYRPFGTSVPPSIGLNSLLHQQETGGGGGGGTSAPLHRETLLRSNNEHGIPGRRRGHARGRFDIGESSSSSFKRYRRESGLPQASTAHDMTTSSSLQNEASSSNINNPFPPRPLMNSVYDPMYEALGLPIDPHLRLFVLKK